MLSLIQGAHAINITGVTGQDYTSISDRFNSSGSLTTETYSGIGDQAYSSYTKAYSGGDLTSETFSGYTGATNSVVDTFSSTGQTTSQTVYASDGEKHSTIYLADGSSTLVTYSANGLLTTLESFDALGRETMMNTYGAQGHLSEQQDYFSNGVERMEIDHAADGGTLTAQWSMSDAFVSEQAFAANGHLIFSSSHYVPAADVIF